jgi:hypothetical protein
MFNMLSQLKYLDNADKDGGKNGKEDFLCYWFFFYLVEKDSDDEDDEDEDEEDNENGWKWNSIFNEKRLLFFGFF